MTQSLRQREYTYNRFRIPLGGRDTATCIKQLNNPYIGYCPHPATVYMVLLRAIHNHNIFIIQLLVRGGSNQPLYYKEPEGETYLETSAVIPT